MLFTRGVVSPLGPGFQRTRRDADPGPDPEPEPGLEPVLLARYTLSPVTIDQVPFFLDPSGDVDGGKYDPDPDLIMETYGVGDSLLRMEMNKEWEEYIYDEGWDEWYYDWVDTDYVEYYLVGEGGSAETTYVRPGVIAPDLVGFIQRNYQNTGGGDEYYDENDDAYYYWYNSDTGYGENDLTFEFNGRVQVNSTNIVLTGVEIRFEGYVVPFSIEGGVVPTIDPPPYIADLAGLEVEIWGTLVAFFKDEPVPIGYVVPVPGHGVDATGTAHIHGVTKRPRMEALSPALVRTATKQICRVMDCTLHNEYGKAGMIEIPNVAMTAVLTETGEVWATRAGFPSLLLGSGIRHLAVGTHRWGSTSSPGAVFLTITNAGLVQALSTNSEYPGGVNDIPTALTTAGANAIAIAGPSPRRNTYGQGFVESIDLFCALTSAGTVHVWGTYADDNAWVKQYSVPGATSITVCPRTSLMEPARTAIVVVVEGGQVVVLDGSGEITNSVKGVKEYAVNYPSWGNLTPAEVFLRGDGMIMQMPMGGDASLADIGLTHLCSNGGILPTGEYVAIPAPPESTQGLSGDVVNLAAVPFKTGIPVLVPSYTPLAATVDRSWYKPLGEPGYISPVPVYGRACISGHGPLFAHADENGALVFTDVSQFMFDVTDLPLVSTLDTGGVKWGAGAVSPRSRNYIDGIVGFQTFSGMGIELDRDWEEAPDGPEVYDPPWNHLKLMDAFHLYDGRIVSTYLNFTERTKDSSPIAVATSPRFAAGMFYLGADGTIERMMDGYPSDTEVPVPPILNEGDIVLDMVGVDHSPTGGGSNVEDSGFSYEESEYRGWDTRPVCASFLIKRYGGYREIVTVDYYLNVGWLNEWGEQIPVPESPMFVQRVGNDVDNLGRMTTYINYHTMSGRSPESSSEYYRGSYLGTYMRSPHQPLAIAKDSLGRVREFNTVRRQDLSLRNHLWPNREYYYSLMDASARVINGTVRNYTSTPVVSGDVTGGILLADRSKVRVDTIWGCGTRLGTYYVGYDKLYHKDVQILPKGGAVIDFGKPLLWCSAGAVSYTPMPPLMPRTTTPGGDEWYDYTEGTGFYVLTVLADDGSVMSVGIKTYVESFTKWSGSTRGSRYEGTWEVATAIREIYPPGTVNTDIILGMREPPAQHWGHGWGRKFGG